MDTFDAWKDGHQAKSIAVEIELSAIEARPKGNTRAHKPCLKAGIATATLSVKNWFVIIVTWIEATSQGIDDGVPVFLNEVPNVHVDWNAFRLNAGDGFGTVFRPKDHTACIDAEKPV